jgi:hypothetical protein
MDILKNVAWAFNGISYASSEEFNKAVVQYQLDSGKESDAWDPEEIVLETPTVQIIYQHYITPTDIRFEDEIFLDEDEADVRVNDPDEEDEQREVAVTFSADNGFHFTALELLYKLHQRLWHRQLGDHIYFEGLLVCNTPERIIPPLFYLHCDS